MARVERLHGMIELRRPIALSFFLFAKKEIVDAAPVQRMRVEPCFHNFFRSLLPCYFLFAGRTSDRQIEMDVLRLHGEEMRERLTDDALFPDHRDQEQERGVRCRDVLPGLM